MFRYPVTLTHDDVEGGFVVSFLDIPEAITQGETEEEALTAARYALEAALDFYFEDNRVVPKPSKAKRGQPVIELSTSMSLKVFLLNEMLMQNIKSAELARRLNTTRQEVHRLTDIHHSTRIDRIASAFQALGKHLDIRIV